MKANDNAPSIRFTGFVCEWNHYKLGDVGKSYSGLSGKTKEDFGHGDGHYVTYLNVFSNSITSDLEVDAIEIDKRQNEVKAGDVFFTTSSETPEEVGMTSVCTFDTPDTYLNSFCFGYRLNEARIDLNFLAYNLRSDSFRKKIIALAQGISRYNISKTKVMELSLSLPQSDEQKKIGDYFAFVDNLITLHQRKYEKLVNLKKAMLDKMFPKNGELVPEVRFSGFSGNWERRRMGDIAEIVGGGTPSTMRPEYWNGNIDWYAPAEMEGVRYAKQSTRRITELGLHNSSARILPAEKTVLFTSRAGIGKMAILKRPGATNQGFQSMILKNGNSAYFIYSLRDIITAKAERIASGSTFLEISARMLANIEILVPGEQEQRAIGHLFEKVDDLIESFNRKIGLLQKLKSAFLEKMFV